MNKLLLMLLPVLLWGFQEEITVPKTYRLSAQTAVLDKPDGNETARWQAGTRFTSNRRSGEFIRVTGHFPAGRWQGAVESWWIHEGTAQDISPARVFKKPHTAERMIVVDKTRFTLKVIETIDGETFEVFTTRVGLGIDECLTQEEGGRCYFTEPGEYKVEFKVYDPDGIEWCIPKSMEQEERYRDDIAKGQRCFRGSLGKYALNIGKTYAIHGTSNPASIGKRISHGCIRVLNRDAEYLYRLMEPGDKVMIVE